MCFYRGEDAAAEKLWRKALAAAVVLQIPMERATACFGLGRIRARSFMRKHGHGAVPLTDQNQSPDSEPIKHPEIDEAVEWFLQANTCFHVSGSAVSMRQLWRELQIIRPMTDEQAATKIQAVVRGRAQRQQSMR